MADTTTRYKMNVRSPYYVVADDTGKPEPPADDDPDISNEEPDVPDEYQQPDTLTEGVSCGDVVNIGEDVGVRIFRLDTENRTGDIDIDFDVSIPVKIQASWNSNTVDANNGDYLGDSEYSTQLLGAGIPASDMNLTSGGATGTLTINKSAETPAEVLVQVTAPLQNDEYNLTFNCPTRKTRVVGTLPATPDGTNLAYNVPVFFTINNPRVTVIINGVTAVNNVAAYDGNGYTMQNTAFVITDNSQIGSYKSVSGQRIDKTVFIDKSTYAADGWNSITFITHTNNLIADSQQSSTFPERSGIYHNGNTWGWATQSNHGLYEYTISPEGDNSVYSHPSRTSWNRDHRQVQSTFRWYEESGSKTGFFDETFTKVVIDRLGNTVLNAQIGMG